MEQKKNQQIFVEHDLSDLKDTVSIQAKNQQEIEISLERAEIASVQSLRKELKEYGLGRDNIINEFIITRKSIATQRTYAETLDILITWLRENKLKIVSLSQKDAEIFIAGLVSCGYSNSYVQLIKKVCSSFYTFIKRRYREINNPFKSISQRIPVNRKKRKIPVDAEIEIMASIDDALVSAVVKTISHTGLPVAALETMSIGKNRKYTVVIRGELHESHDEVPTSLIKWLEMQGMSCEEPFRVENIPKNLIKKPWTSFSNVITTRCNGQIKKLWENGLISERYTFTDIRDYYAEKNLTRGILVLRRLLWHKSIISTDRYLRDVFNIIQT